MSDDSNVGKCPYCGYSPLGYGDYCDGCGEELEPFDLETWFEEYGDDDEEDYSVCSLCGSSTPSSSKSCWTCGYSY